MTKMTWTRPMTEVQQFAANEYVAACGDTEYGAYNFVCDAPGGTLYYFQENGTAKKLGGYVPCAETHVADKRDEFPNGFVDFNKNGTMDSGEEVVVWLEMWRGPISGTEYQVNWHATSNLNRESWEVTKS